MPRSRQLRDAGFTLIELLVVLIILGILAAIAIPIALHETKVTHVDTQVCGVNSTQVLTPAGLYHNRSGVKLRPQQFYHFSVKAGSDITSATSVRKGATASACIS